MGRVRMIVRLAVRDLCRRPAEAALLLIAITSATATLSLGLVMHGVSSEPYQRTREATAGPDVIASVAPSPFDTQPADLTALNAAADDPDVTAHSGPFPYTAATVGAHKVSEHAWVQGRGTDAAAVDQPYVTAGTWVTHGGAVLEASFADALGVGVGDRITVNNRSFRVAGIAVSASQPAYPKACLAPCRWEASSRSAPKPPPPKRSSKKPPPNAVPAGAHGSVWLTEADLRDLVPAESLNYVLNLTLADPHRAQEFVDRHYAEAGMGQAFATWRDVRAGHATLIEKKQTALLVAGWLLSLLALASITVLVGGRMTDQLRRVGLLKAVGGTPMLVAAVLLAEYVAVALAGSALGLTVGRLAAPRLASSSGGLLGGAGPVPFTLSTVAVVTTAALGIAGVATFVPAVRASRTSTVLALADTARPPRRAGWLIALSTLLPAWLLFAVRVAGRRPRRVVLNVVGIAVAVTGVVAALSARAHLHTERAAGVGLPGFSQVLLVVVMMLAAQAGVTAICVAWATALDSRYTAALARTLGATPGQVSAGLSAAQTLPALAGALVGLVGGIGLAELLDDDPVTVPSPWQLIAVVLATLLVTAALTAVPARIGARRPAAHILQAEHA